MKTYTLHHKFFSKLIHIDAYRLSEGGDLQKLGIVSMLQEKKNLFCVEWPDIVKHIIPQHHFRIEFEHIDECTRKVTFSEVL